MAQRQLTPAEAKALAYWPQIEYAARNSLNTADLWAAIREAAADLGLESPGVSIQGVNGLRSLAVGIQRREDEFAQLADSKRLLGRMITDAPWSRSAGERKGLPKFQVRFEHTFTQSGETRTEWRTALFEGKLPRTVGELRALVGGDAVQLANKYGVEHVGAGSLQVLAI